MVCFFLLLSIPIVHLWVVFENPSGWKIAIVVSAIIKCYFVHSRNVWWLSYVWRKNRKSRSAFIKSSQNIRSKLVNIVSL